MLLTTQDLDEAGRLAHRIAVIDRGQVIAEGTSDELNARVGGDRLEIRLEDGGRVEEAIAAPTPIARERPVFRGRFGATRMNRRRTAPFPAMKTRPAPPAVQRAFRSAVSPSSATTLDAPFPPMA